LAGCWAQENQWFGSIDEVRFYKKELSSQERSVLSDGATNGNLVSATLSRNVKARNESPIEIQLSATSLEEK
jgi:hypothetical protein